MAKGVSEILAALMMIVIVSGIGVGIYVYSVGYMMGTTSAFSETTRINTRAIRERVVVVDVIFKNTGTGAEVAVALYNYGRVPVIIQTMFLNGTMLAVNGPEEVLPGDMIWFNGTAPVAIPGGSVCHLKVVSAMGSVYETMAVS